MASRYIVGKNLPGDINMPMLPLTFTLAAGVAFFLVQEITVSDSNNRNTYLLAFFGILIFQFTLIGLRFGYGWEGLSTIQPFSAALIAPLAYMAFLNPDKENSALWKKLLVLLLPLGMVAITALVGENFIDLVLGMFSIAYGITLILLGVKGYESLAWIEINRSDYFYRALWLTASLLIFSGCVDILVDIDARDNDGENIPDIVGVAARVGFVAFVGFVLVSRIVGWLGKEDSGQHQSARSDTDRAAEQTKEQEAVESVERLLAQTSLHLDPNLNLNKVARKVGIPAREISQAINRQLDISFSQYINGRRIEVACKALKETDQPITQIMLQSGFNTKSNFNREFSRIKGMSPTKWRQ